MTRFFDAVAKIMTLFIWVYAAMMVLILGALALGFVADLVFGLLLAFLEWAAS